MCDGISPTHTHAMASEALRSRVYRNQVATAATSRPTPTVTAMDARSNLAAAWPASAAQHRLYAAASSVTGMVHPRYLEPNWAAA